MKSTYIFLCLLFSFSAIYAQVDRQQSDVVIPIEENKDAEETTKLPKLETPNNNKGLSTNNENKVNGISVEKRELDFNTKKEFSMLYKSDLIDPGTIYEKKWRKEKLLKQKEALARTNATTRKDLGTIETYSDRIIVGLRDFGTIDGDLIRVYSSDGVIHPKIFLPGGYKYITISLNEGINIFDFQALNMGEFAPNTAEIVISDGDDKVLTSNAWNLVAGGIAKITVVRKVKPSSQNSNNKDN